VTPLRVALAAGALGAGALAADVSRGVEGEPPPRCQITVDLAPERAYVGEQVHYRVRILRRRDVHALEWHTALSFPTFRAEWLPGVASDAPLAAEGESWLEFLERRAIFPAHPGSLVIPEAALRCASADGEEVVAVPSRTLEVDPLPDEGRPPGFSGLLGPVSATVSARERQLALGGTLHLTVLLEGEGNLWDAPSPRDVLEAIPDVDVFSHAAEIARDAGRTLRLRQYWSFELVPLRAGKLVVPALRFAYFDPATRRYAEAKTRPFAIAVADAAENARERPAWDASAPPDRERSVWDESLHVALVVAIAALIVGTGAYFRARLRRRRRARLEPEPRFETADPGRYADDAARALRDALARRVPGAAGASAEEIFGGSDVRPVRDAAALLGRIDAVRFGGREVLPEPAEVIGALRALREVPVLER
jgi:hypothetical protein